MKFIVVVYSYLFNSHLNVKFSSGFKANRKKKNDVLYFKCDEERNVFNERKRKTP